MPEKIPISSKPVVGSGGIFLQSRRFNPRKAATFGVASAIVGIIILIAVFADTGFSPTGGRPFAPNSAFNTLIPANSQLDPYSSQMVANLTANTHPGIAYLYNNGKPIFYADAATPTYTVTCTETTWGTCPFSGIAVPIPTNAKPDTDSDGHMFVVNIATHTEYDFWQYNFNNGHPTTSWGGTADINGNGQSSLGSGYGSATAGMAGLVRLSDLTSGVINHALVFSTSACAAPPSNYRYPAKHSDGKYNNVYAVPEGSRVQLDPSINVDGISGITAGEKMVAKALQQYGAYAVDCAGTTGPGGMGYYFEDPREEGVANPYPGLGFGWDYFGMDHIPWSKLRVLNASVTQPPSADTTPPAVSLTAPTNGATLSGATTLSVNASDNIGLSNVQFKLDGANLGSPLTTAPYSYSWNTSSTSNGTHTLTAVATDTSGNTANSGVVTVTINNNSALDSSPPSTPKGLTATSFSYQINLSWKRSSDNVGVTGYQIYRNGSPAALATVTTTSYGDAGLAANTNYSYYIVALDAAGNKSGPSPVVSSTTQAPATTVTVKGVVSSATTHAAIAGAYIHTGTNATKTGAATAYTNSSGQYVLTSIIPNTKITYSFSASGYKSQSHSWTFPAGTAMENINLKLP